MSACPTLCLGEGNGPEGLDAVIGPGFGIRAVDRGEDDFPRIATLDAQKKKPFPISRKRIFPMWRPQGDSNPRRRRERAVSWARLDDRDLKFLSPCGKCTRRTLAFGTHFLPQSFVRCKKKITPADRIEAILICFLMVTSPNRCKSQH